MKQTINKDQFRHAFQNMGRGEQFSYEALGLLFDYIEMIESETGEQIELDVIALCCDYSESTIQEVLSYYNIIESDGDDTEEELIALITDYLQENTMLIGLTSDNTFIYQQF